MYAGAAVTLDTVVFNGNTAYGNGGGASYGVSGSDSSLIWKDVEFMNNISPESGGGLSANSVRGSRILEGGRFEGNSSGRDGGGCNAGWVRGSLILEGVCFEENSAGGSSSGNGGGAYLEVDSGGTVIVNHVEWIGNSGYGGGGLYATGLGQVYILNSLFAGNEARSDGVVISGGGGLYSSGVCTLVNTTVVNNRSGTNGYGGGVNFSWYRTGSSNYAYTYEQYLYNSLIWGNTATSGGANMYGEGYSSSATILGNKFIARSSLIENAGTDTYSGTSPSSTRTLFTGTQVVTNRAYDLVFPSGLYGNAAFWSGKQTSIFNNYAGGNYRLGSGSPALDKGNDDTTKYPANAASGEYYPPSPAAFAARYGLSLSQEAIDVLTPRWNQDLAGNNRFKGTIDIGAYEY
jgi:hypothetical protein